MVALFGKRPDSLFLDDFNDFEPIDEDDFPSAGRECKLCGKDGLVWEDFDGKWRLIDPKTYLVHHCKVLEPDDFLNQKL